MNLRLQSASAAALLAAIPVVATAQIVPPAFWDPQQDDVFVTELAGTLTHQTNPFAVPNGPSDTIFQGLVGLRFVRDVSLQRFSADAAATPTLYFDNSVYNYVGLRGGLQWDWEVGRPVFGQFVLRAARDRTAFENLDFGIDNIYTQWTMRGLVGFRFTPSWAVFVAADYDDLSNSNASQKPADRQRTGVEAGVRYQPGSASEFDFLYRREDGDYPNQQVFDSNGQLLPARVDNGYTEDSVLARLWYRPSDATRFGAVVGFTNRNYDNIPARDFSGPVLGANVEWAQTGALGWRLELLRSIESDQYSQSANYVDVKRIALRPSWRATGKVTVDFLAAYMTRDYAGDPGIVLGQPQREDKVTQLGLVTSVEFARNLYGELTFNYTRRNSNFAQFEYDNTAFGVGVRALF
jgi:hypothetical protein